VGQVVAGDRLGDVAPGPGPDDGDDVLGGVGHGQGQEHRVGQLGLQRLEDGPPAAPREVDVEEHHLRPGGPDALNGGLDVGRLPHHLDALAQLGPHAGAEHLVVVDEEDAGDAHGAGSWARWSVRSVRSGVRAISRATSVPSPGALWTSARPPWRAMRPRMDSRMPSRPGSTASGSKPRPRSRTKASTRSGSTSTYTEISSTPAWRA